MKKIFCYICFVISIICIITSAKLFIKNQIIVYVTPKNEDVLKAYFEEAKLQNIENITKVGLGDITEPDEFTAYYSSGETYNINILGDSSYSNLSKYIRENGYNTGDLSPTLAVFAAVFFVIFVFKMIQSNRSN